MNEWVTKWRSVLAGKTVLVTGATGFIGRALVRRLVDLASECATAIFADLRRWQSIVGESNISFTAPGWLPIGLYAISMMM